MLAASCRLETPSPSSSSSLHNVSHGGRGQTSRPGDSLSPSYITVVYKHLRLRQAPWRWRRKLPAKIVQTENSAHSDLWAGGGRETGPRVQSCRAGIAVWAATILLSFTRCACVRAPRERKKCVCVCVSLRVCLCEYEQRSYFPTSVANIFYIFHYHHHHFHFYFCYRHPYHRTKKKQYLLCKSLVTKTASCQVVI